MIELTHQHARRLLRKELDARLHQNDWTALQLHLEGCIECRAYRRDLHQAEMNLSRALRSGWEPVQAQAPLDGAGVAAARQKHQRVRLWSRSGALALSVLLLFFGLGGPARLRALSDAARAEKAAVTAQQSAANPPNAATPAPTVAPGEFPAVVAYEDRGSGNSEIFLLNPGAPPENLTAHPAEDTHPAWSPDGEWIAFLSDRARSPVPGAQDPQKLEVYVTDLTGRRVVQLTSQPGVRWEGPLAWSPDGQYLAVTGIREEEGGQHWIYRVALDGSGAAPLPGTRGGQAPKIARLGGRLAYSFIDNGLAGVAVYDVETGERSVTTWPDNALAPQALPAAAFDWSLDGGALAYIAAVPLEQASEPPESWTAARLAAAAGVGAAGNLAGAVIGAGEMVFASQVMAVRDLSLASQGFFEDQTAQRVAASRWPSAFRAVSWTSGREVVILEDLSDARARVDASLSPECWTIQSIPVGRNGAAGQRTFQVGGLCVESGFDLGSWTPDGAWLVVRGRLAAEASPGLFAVRMTGRFSERAERAETSAEVGQPMIGTIVRLLGETAAPEGSMPRVRSRLLTGESPLRIDPRPVDGTGARPPLSDLSPREDGPRGQLVYTVQNGGMSVVVTSNPDGSGGRVLYASQEHNRCPRWSPDGRHVALVSGAAANLEGLYLLDTERQGSARLRPVFDIFKRPKIGTDFVDARLGCPVWSPPSASHPPRLAAVLSMGKEHYLGVFDALSLEDPGSTTGGAGNPGGAGNTGERQTNQAVFFVHLPGEPALLGNAFAEPAWSQDGRTLFLALAAQEKRRSSVLTVGLPGAQQTIPTSELLVAKSSWGEIRGLTVLPNAPYLVLATLEEVEKGPARFSLRQVSSAFGGLLPRSEPAPRVLGLEPSTPVGANHLARLPDDRFGLVLHGDLSAGSPAAIVQYHLTTRALDMLAQVPDPLYQVEWSPDGRWLVYTTESGLYGLDVRAAAAGKARTRWLSPVVVEDIDWYIHS